MIETAAWGNLSGRFVLGLDTTDGMHGSELCDYPNEFDNLADEPEMRAQKVMATLLGKPRKKASGKTPTVPVNGARL